jgi:hypothetical protein
MAGRGRGDAGPDDLRGVRDHRGGAAGRQRQPAAGLAGWGLLAVAVPALTGRRHWPAVVLLVTTAAIAISVALGYPTGPIWATPLIALYSTAATGRRLALLGGGALAAVPLVKGVSAPTYPGGQAEQEHDQRRRSLTKPDDRREGEGEGELRGEGVQRAAAVALAEGLDVQE